MEREPVVDKLVNETVDKVSVADHEAARLAAQKQRSMWLGLALFGLVILVGLTSALQLKENIQRTSHADTQAVVLEDPSE